LTHFALERTEHGWALLLAGQFEAAIVETVTAPCLSPADSFAGIQTSFHGVRPAGRRTLRGGAALLRAAVASFAGRSSHRNALINCCGHLGLLEEAPQVIEIRIRIGPPLRLGMMARVPWPASPTLECLSSVSPRPACPSDSRPGRRERRGKNRKAPAMAAESAAGQSAAIPAAGRFSPAGAWFPLVVHWKGRER
jgi:hypothetical protein